MRKLLLVGTLFVCCLGAAPDSRAQFCRGVSPWVFDDVLATDPFCGFITRIANQGVTLGCQVIDANHRLYCPNDDVKRNQMAAFLARLPAFFQGGNAFGTAAIIGTSDSNALDVVVNGTRTMRYEPTAGSPNVIGGFSGNSTAAGVIGASIGGGGDVSGPNAVSASYGTVGGGAVNVAAGGYSVVGGGAGNIAGGYTSVVVGGILNTAPANYSAVLGGSGNHSTGGYSVVVGGNDNHASGNESFAAGYSARADMPQCFIYANWSTFETGSCIGLPNVARFMLDHGLFVDYFSRRADSGGNRWVYMGDLLAGSTIAAWNGALLSNAGVWTNASDGTLKDGFEAIDAQAILEQVVSLPVSRWHYRSEGPGIQHVGPTAQDFRAAFGLGNTDKGIGTVDADGVALAAIQGLNAKLEAKIAEQTREIAAMRQMIEQLIARVSR